MWFEEQGLPYFVVFGRVAITPEVIASWVGHEPRRGRDRGLSGRRTPAQSRASPRLTSVWWICSAVLLMPLSKG